MIYGEARNKLADAVDSLDKAFASGTLDTNWVGGEECLTGEAEAIVLKLQETIQDINTRFLLN